VSFDEESPILPPAITPSQAVAPQAVSPDWATPQKSPLSPPLESPLASPISPVPQAMAAPAALGAASEIRTYQGPSPAALKAQTRKSATPRWLFPAIAAGVLVLLAGAVLFIVSQGGFPGAVASGDPSNEDAATRKPNKASQSPRRDAVKPSRETPIANNPAFDATPLVEEPLQGDSSEIDMMPAETMPAETMPDDLNPDDANAAATTDEAPSETEPPSESEPPPPISPEEVVALANHLTAARAALARHDVALAASELEAAAPLARGEPYAQSHDQLAALVSATSEFWAAFDRGATSLVADQELTFGSTTVRVVEATKEQLSYEVAGSKLKRKLRELPLGLAIAVAEKGMSDPQGAEAKLQKGAPLAMQASEALVARARDYWQEAQQQGAAAQSLLAAIEDKYDFTEAATSSSEIPGDATTEMTQETTPTATSSTTLANATELRKLLASAKKSLVDRDIERAATDLAKAKRVLEESPVDNELHAKYDRLRLLTDYLSQFWSHVGKSLAGLQVGEEIIVRDMPVAVIAADRDSLEVRTAGQSHRFTIADMPAGLALALAKMRLNENDPATTMMSAALHAVHKDESYHATALKLWEEAAAAGADVGDLPQVIEDSY
jgi:hypothetical protein